MLALALALGTVLSSERNAYLVRCNAHGLELTSVEALDLTVAGRPVSLYERLFLGRSCDTSGIRGGGQWCETPGETRAQFGDVRLSFPPLECRDAPSPQRSCRCR